MTNLLKRIGESLSTHRVRRTAARWLAVIVVFATTYSLVLPAITMTSVLHGELDGVSVRVEPSDDALPSGTNLELSNVLLPGDPDPALEDEDSGDAEALSARTENLMRLTEEELQLILDAAVDGRDNLTASVVKVLDISLFHNGDEIEPTGPVQLRVKSDLIADAERPVLVHLDDEGVASIVSEMVPDEDTVVDMAYTEKSGEDLPEVDSEGYAVDEDGNRLIGADDNYIRYQIDEEGKLILDEDGNPILAVESGAVDGEDTEETEKPEDTDKSDETEGTEDTDKSDETEGTEDTDKSDETEGTEDTDKSDETEGTEDTDKSDETEGTGDAAGTDKSDATEDTGSTGVTEDTNAPEDTGSTDVTDPDPEPVVTVPDTTPVTDPDPEANTPASETNTPASETQDEPETVVTVPDTDPVPLASYTTPDTDPEPVAQSGELAGTTESFSIYAIVDLTEKTEEDEEVVLPTVDSEGYVIDEDGVRVVNEDGTYTRYQVDEDGNLVLDEDGKPILVKEIDDPQMILLPEGAEVPEGYDQQYTFIDEAKTFAVAVYAPVDALPEGAELVAEVLKDESIETEAGGVVAMDIRFELDGAKTEPTKSVYVVINALGLLPENADPESVSIQHHKDIDGETDATTAVAVAAEVAGLVDESSVMAIDEDTVDETPVEEPTPVVLPENVEIVADSTPDTGVVEIASTEETTTADVTAAFEVGEFSYFTITYTNSSGEKVEVKVHLVDEQGNNIGEGNINLNKNLDLSSNAQIPFIVDILKAEGIDLASYYFSGKTYAYVGVYTDATGGVEVEKIGYWSDHGFQYKPVGNDNWVYEYSGDFYVRYKEATEQTVLYYVIRPDKGVFAVTDTKDLNGNWYYFGSGTAYRYADNEGGTASRHYQYNKNLVKDEPNYPDEIRLKLTANGDLKTYCYEGRLDGLTDEQQKELRDRYHNLFYDVEWVRFADENGQTNPDIPAKDAYSNDGGFTNNTYLQKDGYVGKSDAYWHVDGYLVLRPKIHVRYFIYDENGAPAQLPGVRTSDGFYAGAMLNEGDKAEQKNFTAPESELYGVVDFNDWYLDEACTVKYNGEALTEDTDLYHRVPIKHPQNYNLTIGKVVGEVQDGQPVDINESSQLAGLSGARFTIYNGDQAVVSLEPKMSGQSGPATATTVDAGSTLNFNTVYRLEETTTPNGYNGLTASVYFKAVSTYNNTDEEWEVTLSLCDERGNTKTYTDAKVDNATLTLSVANYPNPVPVQFVKTDGGTTALSGAYFDLYDVNPSTSGATAKYSGVSIGPNGYINWTPEGPDATTQLQLPVGSYWLVETNPPAGYMIMAAITPFRVDNTGVHINDGDTQGAVTANALVTDETKNDDVTVENKDGVYEITIINNPGTVLPSTGGPGTTYYTLIGATLILATTAAVVLLQLKRKGRARA